MSTNNLILFRMDLNGYNLIKIIPKYSKYRI